MCVKIWKLSMEQNTLLPFKELIVLTMKEAKPKHWNIQDWSCIGKKMLKHWIWSISKDIIVRLKTVLIEV